MTDNHSVPEEEKKYTEKEFKLAVNLIKEMTEVFKAEKFKDSYAEELLKLIKNKSKGKLSSSKGKPEIIDRDLSDILEKLQQSLEKQKQKEKKYG